MKRLFVALMLAGFMVEGWPCTQGCSPEALAGTPSSQEGRLKEIHKKIRKEEDVLKQIAGKKKSLLGTLEELDQQISLARQECRESREQIRKLEAEMLTLTEELKSIEEQLQHQRHGFEQRLVAYYRVGRTGALPILFSEGSFGDKMRRIESMKKILASDWNLILAYQALVEEKASKAKSLEETIEQEKLLQQRVRAREKELLAKKSEKDTLLFQLEKDKGLHQIALKESREAGDELERWFHRKQEEDRKKEEKSLREKTQEKRGPEKMEAPDFAVPSGDSFESCKGKLPWPVQGEIFRRFGKHFDPQFGSEVVSKGIDIKTEPETPVRAIWGGMVVYADWFRGYGKLMIIDHGGKSYAVLSHMSRILKKEGDRVEPGEVVGYAGDTGSLQGCLVHFEIWHGGRAQDPMDWIRTR